MKELDKYLGIAFILIAAYLILSNRDGFNSAINGLGALNISGVGAFQGRGCLNAFGVSVGCSGGPTGVGSDPVIIFE